jgi:hemerythrin superfamily protein
MVDRGGSVDALTLLKADHKDVEKHFREFEHAGARARTTKTNAAKAAIRELATHSAIEEQIFYPVLRDEVPSIVDDVLQGLEEHHVVKWLCAEVDRCSPDDERFEAKMTVLIENVRHHVREEEAEIFPVVRGALGRKRLTEIGELLDKAKGAAPTRPHPRSPDTPPANLVMGMVTGAVDRALDVGKRLVDNLTP